MSRASNLRRAARSRKEHRPNGKPMGSSWGHSKPREEKQSQLKLTLASAMARIVASRAMHPEVKKDQLRKV